jgi:hypothetical protein
MDDRIRIPDSLNIIKYLDERIRIADSWYELWYKWLEPALQADRLD